MIFDSMKCMLFSTKVYEEKLLESMLNNSIEFSYCYASLDHETVGLIRKTEAVSIFVNDKVDADMSERLRSAGVKFLITRSTGMDHIDHNACQKMGITVENIPDYGSESIAEHALMLTLCLLRNHKQIQINMLMGDYKLDALLSDNVEGKTVGVIGTGKIGRRYAELMKNMGAHVMGYDIAPDTILEKTKTLQYAKLEDIFMKSDIISLHLPLTPQTHYFFSSITLNQLRNKPWIINTARGGLVDTKAMIDAILGFKIKGYAADVYEHESEIFFKTHDSTTLPDALFNELIQIPNVIITPHQAFAENISIQNMLKQMTQKIEKWVESKNRNAFSY
jgi:D-lactate dehydrogenase